MQESIHRLTFDRSSGRYESTLAFSKSGSDELVAQSDRFLHPRELKRLNDYSEPRRRSFVQGRYCAKAALTTFLGMSEPSEVCVDTGVFGQPIVTDVSNVQVSISHTHRLGAAVAFPESHPVSVDVEDVGADPARTIQNTLTPTEREHCRALPLSWKAACVLIWTLKEVLSKLLRCGLTAPMPVLGVETIEPVASSGGPRWWRAKYSNFGQHQGLARLWGGWCVAFGCPRKSAWTLDPPLDAEV